MSELIALSLKNNPRLISLRGAITIAEARKKAARDWPDPQIRFRKNWGYNEVPAPYTERRTETYNQQVTRTEVNEDGREKTTTSEETVSRDINQTITEGRDKTIIDETIEEHSEETITILPNPEIFEPGGIKTDNRDTTRNGTETRFHDVDPFANEDDLTLQFRLYVPHPGIRKARLMRAEHEIKLARAAALSEEREAVLRIREEYEELQYLKAQIELLELEEKAAKFYSEAQDKMLSSGLITIDKIEYVDSGGLAIEGAQLEFESQRDNLAARVGLKESKRIRITDKLISPLIKLNHSHLEYLIRMSLANRGELTTLRAKENIAKTSLKETQAKKIPWFDYVQAEIGRDEEGGQNTANSWGVQFAMSLPIFSWLNHEGKTREAAVASYYSQKGATQEIITAEVVAAYQNVKRATDYRERARTHATEQAKRNSNFAERLKDAERHKFEEMRYDIARNTAKTDGQRLDAERSYNKALLQLEKALGTSLEQVFTESESSEVTANSLPWSEKENASDHSVNDAEINESNKQRTIEQTVIKGTEPSAISTKRRRPLLQTLRSGIQKFTPKILRRKGS